MNTINYRLLLILSGFLLGLLFAAPADFNGVDFPSWRGDVAKFFCQLTHSDESCHSLSKFPPAYFINAIPAFLLSDILPRPEYSLTFLNGLFLLVGLIFVRVVTRAEDFYGAAVIYLGCLIFSAVPAFYIHSGGLEFQSGILLGIYSTCLYLAIIKRKKSKHILFILFISSLLAPLYKDTNIVFMGLIYFLNVLFSLQSKSFSCLYDEFDNYKSTLYIVFISGVLSLSVSMGYNYYRYHSIFPLEYLEEARLASPPLAVKMRYFFWTFFSPNGGIFISWGASFTVLLLGLKTAGRSISKFGITFSVFLVVISALLLSNWWTPFGWEAWGNRLFIPQAITCLIVLVCTSVPATRTDSSLLQKKNVGFAFAPLFILSLIYVIASYSPQRNAILSYSLWGSDACKAVAELRRLPDFNSWAFKKTKVHLECHFDRFKYIPYQKMDMSPLSLIEKDKEYVVGNGNSRGVVGRGWSGIEHWGVWSNGDEAVIRFIPNSQVQKLWLKLKPFIASNGPNKQRIIIRNTKNEILYKGELKKDSIIELNIEKENNIFDPTEIFKIIVQLPDAASPLSLGVSTDERKLGVGLMSLKFH